MKRNMIGIIGLGAIVALGAAAVHKDLSDLRAQEGKTLCVRSAGLTADQAERINVADGLAPGRPFSIDDYCGYQCRPGSLGWSACWDGCREYCEADPEGWTDSGRNPENR